MKLIRIKGIYSGAGKIVFEGTKTIDWGRLSEEELPELPVGSSIDLTISFDENEFLTGKDNTVWATYDLRQAEIIQNTLLAQNIGSEIKKIDLGKKEISLIYLTSNSDIIDAVDFIWKSDSGLRLKPDWSYPSGETNKSFEQWLSGH